MSEKVQHTIHAVADAAKDLPNDPKIAAGLSGYILGVHWLEEALEVMSEAFKWGSSVLAFVALCLVIGNHYLTRKKLKIEIEQLKKKNEDSEK